MLKLLNLKTALTKICRFGKLPSTTINTRPLKLCFLDQQGVFDLFLSQYKLKSQLYQNTLVLFRPNKATTKTHVNYAIYSTLQARR